MSEGEISHSTTQQAFIEGQLPSLQIPGAYSIRSVDAVSGPFNYWLHFSTNTAFDGPEILIRVVSHCGETRYGGRIVDTDTLSLGSADTALADPACSTLMERVFAASSVLTVAPTQSVQQPGHTLFLVDETLIRSGFAPFPQDLPALEERSTFFAPPVERQHPRPREIPWEPCPSDPTTECFEPFAMPWSFVDRYDRENSTDIFIVQIQLGGCGVSDPSSIHGPTIAYYDDKITIDFLKTTPRSGLLACFGRNYFRIELDEPRDGRPIVRS